MKKDVKYSYKDVSVVPAPVSKISHRAECNPYDENWKLPLFTAPMDSVVGLENYQMFVDKGIQAIYPRTIQIEERIYQLQSVMDEDEDSPWVAMSLQEFEDYLCDPDYKFPGIPHVLIDVANGHMQKIYELVIKAKTVNPRLVVMVGNIANPKTYKIAAEAGVDYIRCGIGAGRGCITSSNVAIHYPMASLIDEINLEREKLKEENSCLTLPKIIADGGIRNYDDIIKALALGADYVMIGSVFTKMLESSATTYFTYTGIPENWSKFKYDPERHIYQDGRFYDINPETGSWDEIKLRKEFYGMASKKGQIALNGKKTRTSEGISVTLPVEYTLSSWIENFTDYLKSAMSYTNSVDLEDFKKSETIVMSDFARSSINS